jgi:hypothetical protein
MTHHREPIDAPGAPAAVGPYVHAVRAGNLVFCSGQLSLDPSSGELRGETFAEQARGCLDNLRAVAEAAGATLAEVPVFDGGGYVATAVAIDDARLLFVPRQAVLDVCRRHGDVALGVIAVLRYAERHWALLVWLLVGVIAWAYVTATGSPWADAKALAILAPAVALVAAVGVLALVERGLRGEGAVLALLLAGAMLWSIGLQARGASLAPRDRLGELADLGPRLQGPTLYPQFEPFAKWFLRDGAPDSLTEPYPGRRAGPLKRAGAPPRPLGASYDLDELDPAYVRRFRTIVVRRGPASRPPAIYRRVWRGRWYEAWERPADAPRRWLGSVAAGSATGPAGRPDCAAVRRLAATARRSVAQLVAAPRSRSVVWLPSQAAPLPAGWGADAGDPQTLLAFRPGAVRGTLRVAAAGEYAIWLASSLGAEVTVSVDGRDVGRARNAINPRGQYVAFGRVRLSAGAHGVVLRRGAPGLRPGTEGGSRFVGPFVLEPAGAADGPLLTVAPARAPMLCRRSLDWVDAVRR